MQVNMYKRKEERSKRRIRKWTKKGNQRDVGMSESMIIMGRNRNDSWWKMCIDDEMAGEFGGL